MGVVGMPEARAVQQLVEGRQDGLAGDGRHELVEHVVDGRPALFGAGRPHPASSATSPTAHGGDDKITHKAVALIVEDAAAIAAVES